MPKETLDKIKNNICIITVMLAVVLIAVLLFVAIPANKTAKSMGDDAGKSAGRFTGSVVGSVEGITKGRSDGKNDGKAEALEARDTTAEIAGRISNKGKNGVLEVLDVSMKRYFMNSSGGETVYTLWAVSCNATYSVDLNDAEIDNTADSITVLIPHPVVQTNYDSGNEKIAEYSVKTQKGSTKDGTDVYINSEKQARAEIDRVLNDDKELQRQADEAAKNQVYIFVQKISVNKNKQVIVDFKEEPENAGN